MRAAEHAAGDESLHEDVRADGQQHSRDHIQGPIYENAQIAGHDRRAAGGALCVSSFQTVDEAAA